jgi:hypothetical protein
LHVNAGSGHLAQAGQGGHCFSLGQLALEGHAGQIGGTILDFKIYKSSCPSAMRERRIPFDRADCWADLADCFSNKPFGIFAFLEDSKVSLSVNPKSVKIITANINPNKHNILDFDFIIYNEARKKFIL